MISHTNQDPVRPDNLRADIVGGHNISSFRALFDQDDRQIIVASDRQLFYHDIKTCEEVGKASIDPSKLAEDERIVACERLDKSLYIFTDSGLMFIWGLDSRDWVNELSLPIEEHEKLISCKLLTKRQYFYTVLDTTTEKITIFYSFSKSERERPKKRTVINECSIGEQSSFDIGKLYTKSNEDQEGSEDGAEKSQEQYHLAYFQDNHIYFCKVRVGDKRLADTNRATIADYKFTCVRASSERGLIAGGDACGRIYLYSAESAPQFRYNRTKLHWHNMPVSDLCFSSTGNTLFSIGGESGCVVAWDTSPNNLGQKQVFARLGMPVRLINCSNILNQLVLSFEDNEVQFMDTNGETRSLKTLTRRTIDMYLKNDFTALRSNTNDPEEFHGKFVGLLWHSTSDTVVTNSRTGCLQFYSPKTRSRVNTIKLLQANILSLENRAKVRPSDITKAALSLDGEWLAFYETRDSTDAFPEVKLHIWQRSTVKRSGWVWIQTADRLHSSTSIADLKFSPDGHYLVSVCKDGTFHILHRICLDSRLNQNLKSSKQMYALGFVGNVPVDLAEMTSFSQDSSVMAMSLKNDTTLIWQIVDPYKLVYECQLSQIESEAELQNGLDTDESTDSKPSHRVLGLHFGYHKPAQSLAHLCEVRSNSIRIWNILNPQETMEYPATDKAHDSCDDGEFTSAAFDQSPGDSRSLDHFAVSTRKNQVLVFKLQICQTSRTLVPIVVIDANLPYCNPHSSMFYTHMCFLNDPILNIDQQCHQDPLIVNLLNRLCLMNNCQELVSITDKLTLERETANNSCNAIKTYDMTDLQSYLVKKESTYSEERNNLTDIERFDLTKVTEKQKRIRNRLEVQRMLKGLLIRIPSQNLPKMEILGPMILDKLV